MKKNNNNNKMKNFLYGILIALGILLIIFILVLNSKSEKKDDKTLSYTDLIKQVSSQNVKKVEMTVGSTSLKVTLKNKIDENGHIIEQSQEEDKKEEENLYTDAYLNIFTQLIKNVFGIEEEEKVDEELLKKAIVPNTQSFIELIQTETLNGNEIELIQHKPSLLTTLPSYILSLLPTLIMVALFVALFKMQGIGDKGEIYDETERKTKVKFDDVAGLDEEKQEMVELVQFLKEPKKFIEMGAKIPKGVLLYGKPGTGKTLIAKAIAGEAGVPFISMSGSEFIEMFAGLGASRVRKLFDKARKMAPCIVFIDEIDAIGSRRTNGSGAESENNQTLNQLLVEMDGFEERQSVIVMAATNRVDILDPALLRPGRFDRQIVVGAPDVAAREKILELHAKKKPFAPNVDFKVIAKNTAGFSGADLENMINEATILATRKNKKIVDMDDVEEATVKVMMGPEKKSKIISEKEKKLTAYHEAGHAVVSKFLPNHDDVHQISIIPRGMAGGYTMYKPTEDKSFRSMSEMKESIVSLLGGRVAEKLILDDISTGASNDIERASKIARDMVMKYGMSEKLGPITFGDTQEEVFLGMEKNNGRNYSEKLAAEIDEEVGNIINSAYKYAERVLKENIDKLHAVAKVLIEKEKISAEEFEEIFK